MSYTVVHQVPTGFTAPLAVGYAAFPGAVVVFAPLDVPHERLAAGLRLWVTERQTNVGPDGTPFVSYWFSSQEPGESAGA